MAAKQMINMAQSRENEEKKQKDATALKV